MKMPVAILSDIPSVSGDAHQEVLQFIRQNRLAEDCEA